MLFMHLLLFLLLSDAKIGGKWDFFVQLGCQFLVTQKDIKKRRKIALILLQWGSLGGNKEKVVWKVSRGKLSYQAVIGKLKNLMWPIKYHFYRIAIKYPPTPSKREFFKPFSA